MILPLTPDLMKPAVPSALLLLTLLACTGKASPPDSAIPEWRLSSTPSVSIGVAEGEPAYELSQATSSTRLADGRIIVANSGSNELRVYDQAGRFVSGIGRQGQGPGEFTGSLQIRAEGPERLSVFDNGLGRLSTFDANGAFLADRRISTEGLNEFPLSTWLYRANWIDGPVDTLRRAEVTRVLDQLADPPLGGYRFVKVADDGKLWMQIRGEDTLYRWEIRGEAGELQALIAVPTECEIHQIGADFLLLRCWGSNDVEQIQLRTVEITRTERGRNIPHASRRAAVKSPQLENALAGELRNLVTAQEVHYADHNSYATSSSILKIWQNPEAMQLHLMAADRRGWVGLLASRTSPVICGMAVGGSTPPGWMEGSPKCSR